MRLDIDKISIMPKSLNRTLTDLKNISDKDFLIRNFSSYDDEEMPAPEHLHFLDKLEFVIGYGRGYWPGVDEEFTLVRIKNEQKYIWIYTDYEQIKTFAVPKMVLDKIIFKMNSSEQRQYFSNLLANNEQNTIIPGDIESFSMNIWSEIVRENRKIREEFNKLLEDKKKEILKQRLDEAMIIFEKTPGITEIKREKGKMIARFGDKEFEIKLR